MDWLLSTGDKIYWYAGDTGDKSELRYTYKATSGYLRKRLLTERIIK
jgi:hypothetical protein